MIRRPTQLSLPVPPTWGGRRRGAGRKLTPGRRPGVPHHSRALHKTAHPLHVTLRTTPAVRCLRADRVFPAVRGAIAAASHEGFRIIEFSAQTDASQCTTSLCRRNVEDELILARCACLGGRPGAARLEPCADLRA